mgnify:CR=1 FL=1
MGKKVLKLALTVLGIVAVLAAAFVLFLTVTEFRPDETEPVAVSSYGEAVKPEDSISLMTWNIACCGIPSSSALPAEPAPASPNAAISTHITAAQLIYSAAPAPTYTLSRRLTRTVRAATAWTR